MEMRDEIKDRVKEQSDIVQVIGQHVDLKKSGARYLGLCPFHGEKTPSFSVHPGQQFYHCFGCGESGDVFSFVMKYYNIDFPAALKDLAGRCNIELPERPVSPAEQEKERVRRAMFDLNSRVAAIYRDCLCTSPMAGQGRKYLEDRGIPPKLQELFRIGYAPSVEEGGWSFLGAQLADEERAAAIESGLLVKKEQLG